MSDILSCWLTLVQAQQQQPKPKGDAAKDKPAKDAGVVPRRVTRSQTRALHPGSGAPAAPAARNAAATSRRAAQPAAPEQQAEPQQQPTQQPQQQPAQQLLPAQEQQQQRAALPPLPDIDGPDKYNPLAECQYVNDIYSYFRHIEPKYRAPANYMESQVRSAAAIGCKQLRQRYACLLQADVCVGSSCESAHVPAAHTLAVGLQC